MSGFSPAAGEFAAARRHYRAMFDVADTDEEAFADITHCCG